MLYICSTPIGNLKDTSYRLINTLKQVDLIAAEDTRTIKKLLDRYDIGTKRCISFHDFSDKKKRSGIIEKLLEGTEIALVSESGTPSVSDPGYELINGCIENGIDMTVIPGPSASISALVLSGLATDNFLFLGFLPKGKGKRQKKILEVAGLPYTLIFYESPNRIVKLLAELISSMADRKAFLARELTKLYEEKIWGRLSSIKKTLESKKSIKGEISLVVEGFKGELIKGFSDKDIKDELISLISQGLDKKDAFKVIRAKYDIDRQRLYNISTKF